MKRDACGGGGGTVDIDDLCSLADGLKEEVQHAGCAGCGGDGSSLRGCRADWMKPACRGGVEWERRSVCQLRLKLFPLVSDWQADPACLMLVSGHFLLWGVTLRSSVMCLIQWEGMRFFFFFFNHRRYILSFWHNRESHIFPIRDMKEKSTRL